MTIQSLDPVQFMKVTHRSSRLKRTHLKQESRLRRLQVEKLLERQLLAADTSVDFWLITSAQEVRVESVYGPSVVQSIETTDLIEDTYLVKFQQAFTEKEAIAHLGSNLRPEFTYPLEAIQKVARSIPNDPLFNLQWHLRNTGSIAGSLVNEDVNAVDVWDTIKGTGVAIAIVDDGLQYTHPDLAAHYRADLSFDYNGNDPDPAPSPSSDHHGTAVAGVAAAIQGNSLGVSGVAPMADLVGIRLIADATTDAQDAGALTRLPNDIDIYSNSWGPVDSGSISAAGQPGPLARAALATGATTGRNGLGSIYVWAGGNGRANNDNVNYDLYANSRFTIAVGAIGADGKQSWYSESGAPLLVVAHSDSSLSNAGITTTDIVGPNGYSTSDYTNAFGGTSSAAPLVSGVVALMLEANPNLTARDVQHVLVNSARRNNATDADWRQNGAGHWVNHKFGFGAVDAEAAVATAVGWTSVGPELSFASPIQVLDLDIPDNNTTGVTTTFAVPSNFKVEYVEVLTETSHASAGNLVMTLTSPSGTSSTLTEVHSDTTNYTFGHTLTSARNWNESSFGTWSLKVADRVSGNTGTLNRAALRVYGYSIDTSAPNISVADVSVDEAAGTIDFEVVLEAASASNVTFKATTLGNSATNNVDYTRLLAAPFTIPAGDLSLTVSIPINDDSEEEANETFWLGIGSAVGADVPLNAAVGTIVDNDDPLFYTAIPQTSVGQAAMLIQRSAANPVVLVSAADVDDLNFETSDNSIVSAMARTTNENATITIQFVDANGDPVGPSASSPNPGEPAVLPLTALPIADQYAVRVTGDQSAAVEVDLLFGATSEAYGGDSTDTNRVDMSQSFISLGSGRYAALGMITGEGIDATLTNDPSMFVDISGTGTPLGLTDDSEGFITTTIGNILLPAGSITIGNNGGIIAAPSADLFWVPEALPTGDFAAGLLPFWDDISAQTGNVYWQELQIDGVPALVVQWDDRPHYDGIGTATFQVQIFESGSVKGRYVYDDLDFGDSNFDFGAAALIGYQLSPTEFFQFSFLDPVLSNGDVLTFSSGDEDLFDIDLSGSVGKTISVVVDGLNGLDMSTASLELIDPDGSTVLGVGTSLPGGIDVTNYDIGINDFLVTSGGVYKVRINHSVDGEYAVMVTEDLVYETEINDASANTLTDLFIDSTALGDLAAAGSASPDPTDFFEINLLTGQRVVFATSTPMDDGAVAIANALDPRLEIYNSSDILLGSDDDSAADGKNAILEYQAVANGVYRIAVKATANSGAYTLHVSEWSNNVPSDINLSPSVIMERTDTSAAPALIGTLTTVDADPTDTHTYSLVAVGAPFDNAMFNIVNDELFINMGEMVDYAAKPYYLVQVETMDSAGATYTEDLTVIVRNLVEVNSIVIGDGTAQRSRVDKVTVNFDSEVNIASDAFAVNRRGAGGGAVGVAFTTELDGNGNTVATLTFSGPLTNNGSLSDGNYDLTILGASVTDIDGNELDGDRDGLMGGDQVFGTQSADAFFRLFGDAIGDRNVSLAEFNLFRSAYGKGSADPNYREFFDWDDNALLGLADFNQFRSRYGTTLGFE